MFVCVYVYVYNVALFFRELYSAGNYIVQMMAGKHQNIDYYQNLSPSMVVPDHFACNVSGCVVSTDNSSYSLMNTSALPCIAMFYHCHNIR